MKHDPQIFLAGETAIVEWQGSLKTGRVIQTPFKYFFIFPDPPIPKNGRVLRKDSFLDRLTGDFVDVTEVEQGRQKGRVEHRSKCDMIKIDQQPRF